MAAGRAQAEKAGEDSNPPNVTPADGRNAPDLLGGSMARRWIEDDGAGSKNSPNPRATRVQRETEGSILAAAKPIKLLLCHPDRQWAPA